MWDENFRDEMRRMRKHMNRLFGNFGNMFSDRRIHLDKELDNNYRNAWTEFRETGEEFIIMVELPGVNKEDIHLDLTDYGLEVKAEKKKEKKHEDKEQGKYAYAKGYFGFSRVIELPENADKEKIKAVYRNGILMIKVKKKKSKKHKTIHID